MAVVPVVPSGSSIGEGYSQCWKFEEEPEEDLKVIDLTSDNEEDLVPSGSSGSSVSGLYDDITDDTAGSEKRCSPAKRWHFRWSNYTPNFKELFTNDKLAEYIVGEEVGSKTHRPHLQGYLEFKTKQRPIQALAWPQQIRWFVARGTRAQNVKYCSKEGKYIHSPGCTPGAQEEPAEELIYYKYEELFHWQKSIVNITDEKPNDRTIWWFWEENGDMGKSALAKHFVIARNAVVSGGKTADMFNQMRDLVVAKKIPKIVLVDIPAENFDFVNYTAIEKIKDGLFYSGKYEGGMVVFNPPHIICMANEPPNPKKPLKRRRWNIVHVPELIERCNLFNAPVVLK